jgi:methylmalonyl-CoA/ethylmalonyl-CoA epimerase
MKPHHIGYLVKDMTKSIEKMSLLGFQKMTEIVYDSYRDIDICFLDNQGYVVELIMPKSEKSVVYNHLKKIGVSPYHICYEVDDIDMQVENLRAQGYIPTGVKQKAPAIHNQYAIFLYHPIIGIIELVELSS